MYCHDCLKRQLASGQAFDAKEWAINCMGLSGYYLSKRRFALAEHCLYAADNVLPPTGV